MIIVGLIATREEAEEYKYISKVVTVANRFKYIARGV